MKNETTHQHGGTPRLDFNRFQLPERPVLDFSVNLNPLGPPEIIKERWMDMVDRIENYPTLEGDGAASYFQGQFGIGPENYMAGNGSTEIIYAIPRILGFKRILILVPSYNDYSRAATLAGSAVLKHPLLPGSSFPSADQKKIFELLRKTDALWLGNPNNPTGSLVPREFLLECAEAFPEKWIIVDEAFMPFVQERNEASLTSLPLHKNILVIHSITKFYALAGLRLGGVIGHGSAISRLRRAKEPWTVNGIAESVFPLLLECGDYERRTHALLHGERRRFIEALGDIEGIKPYPSCGNFVLCQWKRTDDLDDLLRFFLSRGIYVRDCRNFPELEANFFRLAVRMPEENDRLLSALASFAVEGTRARGETLRKT